MSEERDDRPRCTGRRGDGRPCRNLPLDGTTRCWHHSFKVPGRPTKLTDQLRDSLIYLILEGNYFETAAQAVGVSRETLYRWLRRGQDAEAKALEHLSDEELDAGASVYDVLDPSDWAYLDFRHAIKSAEAYSEAELLRRAGRGGGSWQAPMTVLERRHPARWKRREAREVEHSGDVVSRVEVVAVEDQERRLEIASVLAEAGAIPKPARARSSSTGKRKPAKPRTPKRKRGDTDGEAPPQK